MKQYCRYCAHLHVNNFPYCGMKDKCLSESSCKKPNDCKDFVFVDCDPEYQDAFMENSKGYKPRAEKKKKQCDGQVSMFKEGGVE